VPSTIYDISLRYQTEDRASLGLRGIASQADKTAHSLRGIKTLLGTVAGGIAFATGKRMLIDYNSELEQMKLSMSTIGSMQMKMPFEEARAEADKLVKTFEQLAAKAPLASTKDFAEMATDIAPAVAMAGGGFQKLKSMTAGAIAAAAATRTRADVAALDIQQMLGGTVALRDRMARQLLSSRGIDHLEFNKKSAFERASLTESLLNDPALKRMAAEAGGTFKGQISSLKDQIQIALGKVGLPLMKAMAVEAQKINAWIEKHPVDIQNTIAKLGEGLKAGFGAVKTGVSFLVDHKGTLLNLARAFLVFKGVKFGVGAMQGIAGVASRLTASFASLGAASTGLAGGLTAAIGPLTAFTAAAAAGIQMFADWRIDQITKSQDERARFGAFASDIVDLQTRVGPRVGPPTRSFLAGADRTLQSARHSGILTSTGKINEQALQRAVVASGVIGADQFEKRLASARAVLIGAIDAEKSGAIAAFKSLRIAAEQVAAIGRPFFKMADVLNEIYAGKMGAPDEQWKGLAPERGDLNVTIQKIEIASEDPDRFVFGMVGAFEDAAKRPTQARAVITGGF
jgi:hypothetical protein